MLKLNKTLNYLSNTLWVLVGLSIPTLLNLIYNFYFKSLIFLYIISLIVVGIIAWNSYLWDKPYRVFALSVGFLITVISAPMSFFILGGAQWQNYGGLFGKGFNIIIWGYMYSVPLAILSFLPTIPSIVRWFRRKKHHQPIAADKTVDSTESEVTDETVR